MAESYLLAKHSPSLHGDVSLFGAKNATLPILASLILTSGKSILSNVPASKDVLLMIKLLQDLGAQASFDLSNHILMVDTSTLTRFEVKPSIMKQMRASILVLGPLLARFGKARVALPGGCLIGKRPINLHLAGLKKIGVILQEEGSFLTASCHDRLRGQCYRIVLEYPSVGATENIMMFSVLGCDEMTIVNAALEPEVCDLIVAMKKMGAHITCEPGAIIKIRGVNWLRPVVHEVLPDRLVAGAILLATAICGGEVHVVNARADHLDMFLAKLEEMGHQIQIGVQFQGVRLIACRSPVAVNVKTGPYPSFPTDLQAPMMVAQCLARGNSVIEETVFENRFMHVKELQKMGAEISVEGAMAMVTGGRKLRGCSVNAPDIRASCALVLAGFAAEGATKIFGIEHWKRAYGSLEEKFAALGAVVSLIDLQSTSDMFSPIQSGRLLQEQKME